MLIVTYLFGYIGIAVFLKKSKLKKILLITVPMPILLAVLAYLFVSFLNVIPIRSTDLSDITINGYYVYQKMSDDEIQSNFKKLKYETYETDDPYDYLFPQTSDSMRIQIYNSGEKKGEIVSIYAFATNVNNVNKVGDLELGKDGFEQVVNQLGTNYRNLYFIDGFSKIIIYEDKENRIGLNLYFSNDYLGSVRLTTL
jgi:hypothetical protein